MFGDNPRDLYTTLAEMEKLARERSRFNQPLAKETMKSWISQDNRFKDFDAEKVVDEIQRARQCGGTFDVTDPGLRRGGQSRPAHVSGRSRWSAG